MELLNRRVIFVLGKGGVGKTTVAAALATIGARKGLRTLVMETDPRAPLAAALAARRSFDPVEASPELFTMVLDGTRALEEYLALVVPGRMVVHAVLRSRLYQFFVQAAPGLRELMTLGKIYYECSRKIGRRNAWDLLVVDAPASGQALALLRMPTAASATFRASVVGQEAENISKWLRDRKTCAFLTVATADSLAVTETIETDSALAAMHLALGAILFNRSMRTGYSDSDVKDLLRGSTNDHERRNLDHLAEIARAGLSRGAVSARAQARLRSATSAPVIEAPELAAADGRGLISALAESLASRLYREPDRRVSRGGE